MSLTNFLISNLITTIIVRLDLAVTPVPVNQSLAYSLSDEVLS